MKTSSGQFDPIPMAVGCSFNWAEIRGLDGACIRPGGLDLTDRALEVCDLPPDSRIADIGCGAGGTLEHIHRTRPYRSVGLDPSAALVGKAAPRLPSGRLVRGRAETLPFKNNLFQALFCECVLSILEDKAAVLREFARVLREGGFLIVSDVFSPTAAGQGRLEVKAEGPGTNGLPGKQDVVGLLNRFGFSLLLWEEHKGILKEFAARIILAGGSVPNPWLCRVSYFLLIARKAKAPLYHGQN